MKLGKKFLIISANVVCIGFFISIIWSTTYYYKDQPANNTTGSGLLCSPSANQTACYPSYTYTNPALGLKILAGVLFAGVLIADVSIYKKAKHEVK
jgi:TRAP-type C4-dicarboxylate transport system permease small subunit